MKTISIRDLRQHWPRAEEMLQTERALTITRDGKPVAKLLAIRPPKARRAHFDPGEQRAWQTRVFGKKRVCWVDAALEASREDRGPRR